MWAHQSWQGRFLPRALPARERLRSYARWCNAVEGNSTFYATPTRDTVASWAQQTSPDFGSWSKLPKVITHEHRLRLVDGTLDNFLTVIERWGRAPMPCGFSYRPRSLPPTSPPWPPSSADCRRIIGTP